MAVPDKNEPPDQRTITALVVAAEQFEAAVRSGQNLMASIRAHRVVKGLRRFFPSASSVHGSPGIKHLPVFVSEPALPVSDPDPQYAEVVRAAVQEFKEAINKGDLTTAVAALKRTGLLSDVPSLKDELERLELDAARKGGSSRLRFLPRMAKLALWLGETDKAAGYASEALRLTLPPQVDPFDTSADAIHDANMVTGVLALRRGDIEGAKQCLLASARTRGSLELRQLGPNLTLADELLKKGEREAVIQYLDHCRSFWAQGQRLVDKWVTEIRDGTDPQFDILHLSV
jgi:hypothetical protein